MDAGRRTASANGGEVGRWPHRRLISHVRLCAQEMQFFVLCVALFDGAHAATRYTASMS